MTLHPEAAAYLSATERFFAERFLPPLHTLPPPEARRVFRSVMTETRPPLPEMGLVEDRDIAGPGGPVPIRILRPPIDGMLPVVVYFHGGGWVIGGIEESAPESYRLALRTPALVISVAYRLAPEYPWPAGVDDARAAVAWAVDNAYRYGGDAGRLMVAGNSAGGNLAAVVARRAALAGGPPIRLQVLFCPALDLTFAEPSMQTYAQGYGLTLDEMLWYRDAYLQGGQAAPADHPEVSPALHPPPPDLAPAVIVAAECDPLHDDAAAYEARLRLAGIPVRRTTARGMIHSFNTRLHAIPSGSAHLSSIEDAMMLV